MVFGGLGVYIQAFLTSAVDGGQWYFGRFGTKDKCLAPAGNQSTTPRFCLPPSVVTLPAKLFQAHSLKQNKNNPIAGLCNIGSFQSADAPRCRSSGYWYTTFRRKVPPPFPRTWYS